MPLVRITLRKGKPNNERQDIANAVFDAMVGVLKIPVDDHFMVVSEHDDVGLQYHPTFMGIHRTDGILIIQVFLQTGRSDQMKADFYADLAECLVIHGVRKSDIFVSLVETGRADWSFGCAFRRIRPPIPTASAHTYRAIRPPLTRCGEA